MSLDVKFSELLGKTLSDVVVNKNHDHSVRFKTNDGMVYELYHSQSCCESVTIEDIAGELSDLIGSPITMADESTNSKDNPPEYGESFTWTFYKLATIKGYVDIRWLGTSNGYYSESVYFRRVE